jgi:signal transduction histidine kinase
LGGGSRFRPVGERLLVHAVSLLGLVAVVVGVYALVVLGIGSVPSSGQWTLLLFSALAACVAAVAYTELRPRLRSLAEGLVRPERSETADAVASFGAQVARGVPLDDLLLHLAEVLRSSLGLERAEVWTSSGGILELAASDPPTERTPLIVSRAEESVAARAGVVGRAWPALWLPQLVQDPVEAHVRIAPMTQGDDFVGLVVAARSVTSEPFGESDDELLAQLARQASLAVRNVRLGSALEASLDELRQQADALRESRARVVTAADAERRRIERDLHDGAQQHLVGLAVNLKVARDVATTDPERARAILEQLSTEIHTAIEDVRDLAHGIYPPLLADRGLGDALRATLARSPVPGRIEADGAGRYVAQVEATVYFCCVEAIQNAAKHAGPDAQVIVRLWERDETLLFEVRDDGRGFDPAAVRGGAGLANMRDRVGALGGQLRLDAAAGRGAAVIGGVPLRASAPARRGTTARP